MLLPPQLLLHCCHMHTYKLIHPIVLKNTNTLIHSHSKLTNATLFNHIRFKRYTIFVAHERHRDCRLANNNSITITHYNKNNSNNYNDIQKYIRCSFSTKIPQKQGTFLMANNKIERKYYFLDYISCHRRCISQ